MENSQQKRLRDDEERADEGHKKMKEAINPNHSALRPPQVIRNLQNGSRVEYEKSNNN